MVKNLKSPKIKMKNRTSFGHSGSAANKKKKLFERPVVSAHSC